MKLLLIGDLTGPIAAAGRMAAQRGARVSHVDSLNGALETLRGGLGVDLVLCDIALDVAALLNRMRGERLNTPVVACGIEEDGADSALREVRRAAVLRAVRTGAKEYVPLPPDPELIAALLEAVSEEQSAFIADDPAMTPVLSIVERVAPSTASVLITGESGTGKEVMARFLHAKSKRAAQAFVAVNCAAIPDNLLESELFGHEKGAFTGAIARRIGKFEEAHGGTLLLDEISEMNLNLQAKLLRVIQEREIDRVGGTAPVKVDIRVLATSNRDLEAEVRAKRFREDLYYRLNVVQLHLPALRERPRDIAPLANHFAEKYARLNGMTARAMSAGALARLEAHAWPGNVRELENTLHRAVLLAHSDPIEPEAIVITGTDVTVAATARPTIQEGLATQSEPIRVTPSESSTLAEGLVGRTVADVERDLILGTLNHCLGNRTHAATILGISIRTLRNKLKLYQESGAAIAQERAAG